MKNRGEDMEKSMKAGRKLAFLCMMVYFVSYLTRHNFAAVLAEIIASGMTSKMAATVTTVGFISYGAGQLVSGFFGDKCPPEKLILIGLLVTSLMNALLPFCTGAFVMCIVWGCNGLAQAMLWPPMVKLLSVLDSREYNRACTNVTVGSGVGTISIYCLVPLILTLSEWQTVFFVCAAAGLVMTAVWGIRIPNIIRDLPSAEKAEKQDGERTSFPKELIPVTLFVMLGIVAQGVLRDGVTTWTPVYLNQVYKFDTVLSILISVMIPILSIIGVKVTAKIYNDKIHNEYRCALLLFLIAVLCGSILNIPVLNPILFAFFSALITACMHGINLMLITVFPRRFQQFGWISTMAGMLNACTYIGSTLASSGFEWVSSEFGWSGMVALWPITALLGSAFCFWAGKRHRVSE